MKTKKTALVALICLLLCASLIPVSAFADDTLVIIGGAVEKEAAVVTQNTSASGGTTVISSGNGSAAAIIADSTSSNVIAKQSEDDAGSVVVMPNGSVVTTKPAATVTTTVTATVTEQAAQQVVNTSPSGLANEIYKRINEVRTANGLGILGYDQQLQATADLRARESAVSFGHTRPDGSAAVTAVTVDYNVAGENLIQCTNEYATVDILVDTWLNSETHKANILLADFSQTAIGVYEQGGVTYVSQIFTD